MYWRRQVADLVAAVAKRAGSERVRKIEFSKDRNQEPFGSTKYGRGDPRTSGRLLLGTIQTTSPPWVVERASGVGCKTPPRPRSGSAQPSLRVFAKAISSRNSSG